MNLRFADLVKVLLLGFGLVLVLLFLGAISRLVLIFFLVIIIAMILTAPVSWLERRRIPRSIGALIVLIFLLGGLALIAIWLIPPFIEQGAQFIAGLPGLYTRGVDWLTQVTMQYPSVRTVLDVNAQLLNTAISNASSTLLRAGIYTLNLLAGLGLLIIVLLMALFTVIQPRALLRGLLALIPGERREQVARALHITAQQMRAWLFSSVLVGLINGTIAGVGLWLLGVQPAYLLAALVFFGEFFPYIGPIAASVPAIIIALTISPLTALWVLLLYIGIHQLEAAVLSPLIVARQMKFHPLSVAFAILALGQLYGVLGAFLAIPVLAMVKAFYTTLVLEPRQVNEQELDAFADIVIESHAPAHRPNDESTG